MITKDQIKKVGFTEDTIFIETKEGIVKSHPISWFKPLAQATKEQRQNFTLSPYGIHWEELDEDLSFQGFFEYQKKDDNPIARFFKEFPEINMSKFAMRIGVTPQILRHYACGSKTPSAERKKEIERAMHKLGNELLTVQL